ncbi:MAG: 2-isopropylmalate synthase, partial [Ginsengibacter sp.]
GFLKNASTYEIINPEEVGADSSKIVLTARSGRSALAFRFQKLGYQFDRNDVDFLYERFLEIADTKKEIGDSDLSGLAGAYQKKALVIT